MPRYRFIRLVRQWLALTVLGMWSATINQTLTVNGEAEVTIVTLSGRDLTATISPVDAGSSITAVFRK